MNRCQNCGQINSAESQFCRYCGTKFPLPFAETPEAYKKVDYEERPPRPYSWKSEEFQSKSEPRKTGAMQEPQTRYHIEFAAPPAYRPDRHAALSGVQFLDSNYRCRHCMSHFPPKHDRRISTAGWIVFAVLLVTFFPLFWIGLLIKEDVCICPSCGICLE